MPLPPSLWKAEEEDHFVLFNWGCTKTASKEQGFCSRSHVTGDAAAVENPGNNTRAYISIIMFQSFSVNCLS